MTPKLSIIIPTKNRPQYCIKAAEAVLEFNGDIEVIIQDSSTNSDTKNAILKISDSRLSYFQAAPDLNMTQNFESSAKRAKGEYIVMIGDDDGLSPWIWDCIRLADRESADSVVTREIALHYYWPDFSSKYNGSKLAATLLQKHTPYQGAWGRINLEAERNRFLKNAGQGCAVLPRIYHGLIRRSLLERIVGTYGAAFFGVSPDVSFSYVASCSSTTHLWTDLPISISGSGAQSNAGRSARREHEGSLEEDPHLVNYKPLHWPATIPRFFSVETVWAQATVTAIEACEHQNIKAFSFARLYALCLLRHWPKRHITYVAIRNWRQASEYSTPLKWGMITKEALSILLQDTERLRNVVRNRLRPSSDLGTKHQDIHEATRYLLQHHSSIATNNQ